MATLFPNIRPYFPIMPCGTIPLIIASYDYDPEDKSPTARQLDPLNAAVCTAWDRHWRTEASSDRFVSSLICEGSLATGRRFPDDCVSSVLFDTASTCEGRAILSDLSIHLKANSSSSFSITPTFEDETSEKGESHMTYSSSYSSSIPVKKTYQFAIQLFMGEGDRWLESLALGDGSWILGSTSPSNAFVHECGHILAILINSMLTVHLRGIKNPQWMNREEEEVIYLENRVRKSQGNPLRVSHKAIISTKEFESLAPIFRLEKALEVGADGTVQVLCDQLLAVPKGSEQRMEWESLDLGIYASAYLKDYPRVSLLEVDSHFRKIVRARKDCALARMLFALVKKDLSTGCKCGFASAKELLTEIEKKALFYDRLDAIYSVAEFWEGLTKSKFVYEFPADYLVTCLVSGASRSAKILFENHEAAPMGGLEQIDLDSDRLDNYAEAYLTQNPALPPYLPNLPNDCSFENLKNCILRSFVELILMDSKIDGPKIARDLLDKIQKHPAFPDCSWASKTISSLLLEV